MCFLNLSQRASSQSADLALPSMILHQFLRNPKPIIDHLRKNNLQFEHESFPDHHQFTEREIKRLRTKELILTTEKDYTRLKDHLDPTKLYYLPIETNVSNSEAFREIVLEFMTR